MIEEARDQSLAGLSDAELVRLARQPCPEQAAALEYLISKYQPMVERRARRYFLIHGERRDLMQEGLIGLYQAVAAFDPAVSPSFARLAATCARRRIISAVRRETARRRQPLLPHVSLHQPLRRAGDEGRVLGERLPDPHSPDPLAHAAAQEQMESLYQRLRARASTLEWACLERAMAGFPAAEIAETLQQSPKVVANALYRARRKARRIMSDQDA